MGVGEFSSRGLSKGLRVLVGSQPLWRAQLGPVVCPAAGWVLALGAWGRDPQGGQSGLVLGRLAGQWPAETETRKRTGAPRRPWQALCPPPASAAGGGRGDGQARETAGPEAGGREAGTFPQACAAPEHREPLPQHRGALLFAGTLLTGSASLAHSFPGSSQGFRRWWGAPGPGSRRSGWGVLAPFLRWHWIALDCPHSITQPQFSRELGTQILGA